jgi:hypothetical protein
MATLELNPDTRDAARIRIGAAFRLLAPSIPTAQAPVAPPPEVADSGRIRVGAAFRLLPSA